jgi:protein-cysteine N-palmitoyltransferase HHAT
LAIEAAPSSTLSFQSTIPSSDQMPSKLLTLLFSGHDDIIEGVAVMRRTSWPYLLFSFLVMLSMGWTFFSIKQTSIDHLDVLKKHLGEPWAIFAPWSIGNDQADVQWRDLVKNLPILGPALFLLSFIARGIRSRLAQSVHLANTLQLFYAVCGVLFVSYLHGAPVIFSIVLVLTNYFCIAPLSKWMPFKAFMLVMWTAHVGILFVNDHYKGYRFSLFSEHLRWMDEVLPQGALRWSVVFNMCTLRMIAYNVDYHEAHTITNSSVGMESWRSTKIDKHLAGCTDCAALRQQNPSLAGDSQQACHCYKLRTETPRKLSEYGLRGYLAYIFYVPLYVAGPMTSYNAFISHTHQSTRCMSLRQGVIYCIRIANLFVLLTFQLHFNFLNAIREEHAVFDNMPLGTKLGFFLFTLGFLWMKFNFLWKFFRLLAIVDGVEAPEDMNRCFSNTLTIQSFWKDWHSSFNLWIVRYMYIPMGGSKNRLLSIFPIFIFIAVWHDIELRLLWWALIMCVCFIPEVVMLMVISRPQFKWLRMKPYYRYIRAAGGAVGMFVLITANLVGYGTGTRNVGKGLSEAFSFKTIRDFICGLVFLFCSAVVAVRDRDAKEAEKRRLKVIYNIKQEHRHD